MSAYLEVIGNDPKQIAAVTSINAQIHAALKQSGVDSLTESDPEYGAYVQAVDSAIDAGDADAVVLAARNAGQAKATRTGAEAPPMSTWDMLASPGVRSTQTEAKQQRIEEHEARVQKGMEDAAAMRDQRPAEQKSAHELIESGYSTPPEAGG